MNRKRKKGRHSQSRQSHQHSRPHGKSHSEKRGHSHSSHRGHSRGHGSTLRAVVDKNRKGFAFLIFENKKLEDAFVPAHEAETLFHGDRVEVTMAGRGRVVGIRVLAHRFREVVGRFAPDASGTRKAGWVVYERKNAREDIPVTRPVKDLRSGDWVRAKLHFHDKGRFPVTGEILEVYGQELPPSADIQAVSAEFGLNEHHTKTAKDEAAAKKMGPLSKYRKDLTQVPFITIDGETARDFDDAIYVERTENGYVLWVAIADVSHFVNEGSSLDQEARERGTSVYFPERAFHMLPRELSENLCSLRPNEQRMALVAKMTFDLAGKREDTEVMEALIENKRRATYTEIQKEWESQGRLPGFAYAAHFGLYQSLRLMRQKRGSIDFELPEAEVIVDPQGDVVTIKNRRRFDAHRLIEEFMIAANEAVTEWMMQRNWPFVYRVHDFPSPEALTRFASLAAVAGIKFRIESDVAPKALSDIVQRLEGHPAQALLNMALLRSMKQAVYSETHGIHYGLASQAYTHFTSPIRRYPDLVVHRLLKLAIRQRGEPARLGKSQRKKMETDLAEICDHCSYRERLASDAERESIRLKQVRLMAKNLGNEFSGKIIGMVSSGLFAQLDDPYVEGLIPAESIPGDLYQFDEEKMIFVGKKTKKIFRIGDRIQIRVVRADLDRRQIDFALIT